MRAKDGLLWLETSLRMLMKDGKPTAIRASRETSPNGIMRPITFENRIALSLLVEQLPQVSSTRTEWPCDVRQLALLPDDRPAARRSHGKNRF